MGQKIKYMGSADIREIKSGTDANGQLQDKLPVDLVWDRDNNWLIDTGDDKYSNVAPEFWELLLEGDASGKEFKDVSDLKRIPTNEHQQIFLGMKKVDDEATDEVATEQAQREAQANDDNANPAGSEASGGAPSTTTVGGSTTGDGGTPSGSGKTGRKS